jgi:DNA-binding CsgD family transcriptional regulator
MNDEAVSILSYPQTPRGNGHGAYFLKQRIDSLLPQRNGSSDPRFSSVFASGRRHYQVRVFTLKSNFQGHLRPTLAVLLERNRPHPDLLRAARRFHLTQRETAALELLMQGYTTKQIACRMDISPNTAKAFLRSVMFKSGAFNRAGILAKVLQL